jgi:hypothetical protein
MEEIAQEISASSRFLKQEMWEDTPPAGEPKEGELRQGNLRRTGDPGERRSAFQGRSDEASTRPKTQPNSRRGNRAEARRAGSMLSPARREA